MAFCGYDCALLRGCTVYVNVHICAHFYVMRRVFCSWCWISFLVLDCTDDYLFHATLPLFLLWNCLMRTCTITPDLWSRPTFRGVFGCLFLGNLFLFFYFLGHFRSFVRSFSEAYAGLNPYFYASSVFARGIVPASFVIARH
jgi:hypothetical protein